MVEDAEPKRAKGAGVKFAYESLRDEILSLALPPGSVLDETTLAERFAMSRSPIREALIRLAGEDLVVTLANRSTVVAPIDVQSFPTYIAALDVAQRAVNRLAAQLRRDSDLVSMAACQQAFVAAVAQRSHLQMSETNMAFHLAIAEAGQNPYFTDFYARLLRHGRRMLHLHFDYLERGNSGTLLTDEHDEMLDAIRHRDADRAERLAHAHTRQFQDNFLDYMKRTYLEQVQLQI